MQQSVMRVPCTGEFHIRVQNERWEMDVHTNEGTTFFLCGAKLQDEPLPIVDLNTGQILDIPQFMWTAINDRIMDMLTAEKSGAIMPAEIPTGIN